MQTAAGVYLCEERGQLHTSSSDALLLLLHMSQVGIPDVTPECLFQFVSYSFLHLQSTSYDEQHIMTHRAINMLRNLAMLPMGAHAILARCVFKPTL